METLVWLILLGVFLIVEAITAGLATIWFAGGALISAIAAYMGATLNMQIFLFIVISALLLIFTRPLAMRYFTQDIQKTNADSLIGKTAVVIQPVNNLSQTGQVRIHDIEWMARTEEDGVVISENSLVQIERIEGVKLIVKELKQADS